MSKAKTKKPAKSPGKPTTLDEDTSAHVLAEYITLDDVDEQEIKAILDGPRTSGLSHREIAVTFRISDVLGVPDAFKIAPRFELGFATVRSLVKRGDKLGAV